MTGWLALLLHAALGTAAAPVLAGMQARVAARWRGAEGPAPDQAWRDLVRLWRKGTVRPAGASFVFAAAPAVSLAAALAALCLVPGFTTGMATAPLSDLVVAAALLAVSRGVPVLAAWDAGSALVVHRGGRGLAARLGTAPVLLLVALVLLLLSGGTNLDAAVPAVRDGTAPARGAGLLAGAALLALVLDGAEAAGSWSGRQRAAWVLAAQVRVVAGLTLAAALLCPFGLASGPDSWVVGVACWALKLLALGLAATALGAPRLALPVAALLALMAVVVAGMQGAA